MKTNPLHFFKRVAQNRKQQESGYILFVMMLIVVVLTAFAGMAIEYTQVTAHNTQRLMAMQQAIGVANGILDSEFVQWRVQCQKNQNMPENKGYFSTTTMPTFPDMTGASQQAGSFIQTIPSTAYTINAIAGTDPTKTPLGSTSTPTPSQSQNNYMTTYNYLAEADVPYANVDGSSTVKICKIFQKSVLSPFHYAVFYNDDLEINPGSLGVMSITGNLQTNGSLYTGGNGSVNNLTINGKTTYTGNWNQLGAWAPTDTFHSGTPCPPNFPNYYPSFAGWMFPVDYNTLSSLMNATMSTNPNTADGYREIIERPRSGYTDTMVPTNYGNYTCPSQRMWNQAGVKILITTNATTPASTTVQIYDAAGTLCTAGSANSTDKAIYNTFSSAITTNYSLTDGRESNTLLVSHLDISKIVTALSSGGTLANSGCNIIYITDTTANSGISASGTTNPAGLANRGIEIVNGYKVPGGGLTIVSDNPVYICGDFNDNTTNSPGSVPSNVGAGAPSYANGYTVQPCSIMADAITVLSNSWTDAKSSMALSSRLATNTTINCAFVAGIVTSGAGFTYSGGLENYTRYLEDWNRNSNMFTYYGSMVELFQSKQASGVWQGPGNYYMQPTREWYLDNRFLQTSPPGILAIVNYVKSQWFKK